MSRYQLLLEGRDDRRADEADSRRSVAVGLTDIGVATDNSSNTGLIPPGSNKQVTIGQYNVSDRLPRCDGAEAACRPLVRSEPAVPTT